MPTAVLLVPPYLEFFDVNGDPLAGGSVTTYAAGTNTPKDTYTSAVGDVPAPNPIILDSSGRATIWGNGAYKLVVKDSTGAIVPFGTTDGIITFNTSSSSIDAILPDQTGQAGKFLGTNGANASWQSPLAASIFSGKATNGLILKRDTTDAANDIAISAGTAVSDDGTTVMTLAVPYIKQADVVWAVGTGLGGLDTGVVANSIYYVWLINRPDTGVTDVLISLSSTAPTMPTNYTKKARIGSFARVAAANNAPTSYAVDVTPWVAYTPTFTNWGTATAIAVWSRRNGENLEVRGRFTAGTPTASEARINMGYDGFDGFVTTAANVSAGTNVVGAGAQSTASGKSILMLAETAVSYITYGSQESATAGLTKSVGLSSGTGFSFFASVPISGWSKI